MLPPPHQQRRLSLRARAPEQHTGTPSRGTSAFEPWEAVGEQTMCGCAHSGRRRCLLRLRLRHETLMGVCYHFRTSGVAIPVVLERLSNTPARLQEPSVLCVSRGGASESKRWVDAHSGRPRRLPRLRLRRDAVLRVCHHLRTSGAAIPFVLERLSNTPARLQESPPRSSRQAALIVGGCTRIERMALDVCKR